MQHLRRHALVLRLGTAVTLAFIYVPLIVVAISAFDRLALAGVADRPPHARLVRQGVPQPGRARRAVDVVEGGVAATPYRADARARSPRSPSRNTASTGKDAVSFLIILPLALPGIVTGMALNATFTQVLGVDLSLFTVIVGHATFCIVVVFNNAVARLRKTRPPRGGLDGPRREQLGTFRFVTFPPLRTALVAGALLAFALSFDEIIVTTFTVGQARRPCRSGSSPTTPARTSCRS